MLPNRNFLPFADFLAFAAYSITLLMRTTQRQNPRIGTSSYLRVTRVLATLSTVCPALKTKLTGIYALEVREVWAAVVLYLDKVSTRSHSRKTLHAMATILHTQCRENFRSMRQFTEVFSISKQLRSVGKIFDDDELKGVLYCGIDPDLLRDPN